MRAAAPAMFASSKSPRDPAALATQNDPGRRYETRLRAAQLEETLAAAKSAIVVPLAASLGLTALFIGSAESFFVLGILVANAVLSVGACAASLLVKPQNLTKKGVTVASWSAIAFATMMGAIWATVPVKLFGGSDPDGRLVVLAASVGVMANCYRLGSLRYLCAFYMAPICVGAFIGLATSGSSGALVLAILVPLYGWLVAAHCEQINAFSAPRIIDHLRVTEQDETIEALLLDFDENTSDWLWRTDEAGRFVDVSDRFAVAVGFPVEQIEGAAFEDLMTGFGTLPATSGARAAIANLEAHKPFRNQLVEIRKSGASVWCRLSGRPLIEATGTFLGYHGVGSDMTGARDSESRITYLANFDALTGFANRANFQVYGARQCEAAVRDGHCRALLFIDLDGFKSVNDNFGHDIGDEVLKQVATRLNATAPADAYIARLGGDEFALWLEAAPRKAEKVAEGLIEILSTPFDIDGLKATIGASIGIAFAPRHSTDPEDLMVKADIALYEAKREGKGRCRVFQEEFEAAMAERRRLENDLKLALARGEFELHYQPQINVANGKVVGFEALIRWRSPDRGFVSPADFVPAAESSGLIEPIGHWVLNEACLAAATWPSDIAIAVNISPPQVRDPSFVQSVTMALSKSGLHPNRLEIEVTESVFLEASDTALDNLRDLRNRGVRIALDDFGVGNLSLSSLVAFPADRIKIDRTFIRDMKTSSATQAMVDAILALAKTLSIKLIAEGVETKEQALALKERRCDGLQGYLFGKPCLEQDVEQTIRTASETFRRVLAGHEKPSLGMMLEALKKQAS